MDSSNVEQTGNVVGGDMAGRDINKNYYYDATKPSQMQILLQRFRKEREKDTRFLEVIAMLRHYSSPVLGEVIGLEEKLKLSGRTDKNLIEFARNTKEIFAKKIAEFQFSETAQEIHVYLLGEIYTRFYNDVYPKIVASAPQDEVQSLIRQKVIEPVQSLLDENDLKLYAPEINGMLYFLTGNCHVKWV